MELIDEKTYQSWKAKNCDGYSRAVFDYAEKWARAMEKEMEGGKRLEDVAKNLSHTIADEFGLTGFQYGCVVSILAQCWIHGEQLRRWHNIDCQIKDEGERANEKGTVLNPAIMNIEIND